MNEEAILPQSTPTQNLVAGKSNFAQDAFWQAVLGKEVELVIQSMERDYYTVHQVDQYNVIVENEELGFMLISKAAIIAVVAPDTAYPDLAANMIEGVKRIKYKPSGDRLQSNKKKFDKKPYTSPRQVLTEDKPVHVTTVQYKQKRTYGQ